MTKPARSDARNTTAATSSGLHGRPRPMFGRNAARAWVGLLMAALAVEWIGASANQTQMVAANSKVNLGAEANPS